MCWMTVNVGAGWSWWFANRERREHPDRWRMWTPVVSCCVPTCATTLFPGAVVDCPVDHHHESSWFSSSLGNTYSYPWGLYTVMMNPSWWFVISNSLQLFNQPWDLPLRAQLRARSPTHLLAMWWEAVAKLVVQRGYEEMTSWSREYRRGRCR